jgi:hypothetical protein
MKDWTHSETFPLARERCRHCRGVGLVRQRIYNGTAQGPCGCVLRAIFRACLHQFQYVAHKEKFMSKPCLAFRPGKDANRSYGRPDEEYIADFCLVSRRALDPAEWAIFSAHYLLGANWRICCHYLRIDKGTFFHSAYRIEKKLGRVFRELEPYSLWPLSDYFCGPSKRKIGSFPANDAPPAPPVRAPLMLMAHHG